MVNYSPRDGPSIASGWPHHHGANPAQESPMFSLMYLASKRHVRRKQCEGKRTYDDSQTALSVANRMCHQGEGQLRAYHCSFCHKWHVGHPNLHSMEFPARGKYKGRN